jgi:MoaA/NifB/PqqE/SkfB family radical SAM enzyme
MTDNHIPSYLPRQFKRIHIELTNRCNFSCVFCPDGIMTRERGFMDEALACSAVDQIAELHLAEKITFHVMGEPLLHPRFFSILDHARQAGLPVGLTTNGALLTSDTIHELARRDLHQIDISLQSPDEESFRATRGTRMDFTIYRKRLTDLLTAGHARPEPPVFKIRIMTTRFAAKMKARLGIPDFLSTNELLQQTVTDWTHAVYDALGKPRPDPDLLQKNIRKIKIHAWNVIEISPKVFIETYVLTDWGNAFSDDDIIEAGHGYCFGMRDHFAVLHNGDVVLCCIDYDGKTVVGNIGEQKLIDILWSPELEKVVRGFHRMKLVHPHCRTCLGSTGRIASYFKPALSVLGLKLLKPFFYRQYRLYE